MVSLLIKFCIKNKENISPILLRQTYAKLCSSVSIFLNIILFIFKLLSGIISGSSAIITDAFNNLADAGTSFASFLGFCLAGIGAGKNHLFGHGRYEWLMGFLYSLAILIMGCTLAKNSIICIISPKHIEFNALTFFILICSILIKLYMFFYNRNIGDKIDSPAMKATATDCISDMVATTAILSSLLIEYFTGWFIDGWCGLLVSLFIIISGFKSIAETTERLLGQSPNDDIVNKIKSTVMKYPEVQSISDLIIHDYGLGHFAVSMHIVGYENQNNEVLNNVANEISYDLYYNMSCDTTIQTEFLITDSGTVDTVFRKTTQEIQKFEPQAKINNLRIVKSSLHTNIFLVIAGPNKLQKLEKQIHKSMNDVVLSIDDSYRAIVKLIVAHPHRK